MKRFDGCDIVVHVALNRGFRGRRRISPGAGREAPKVYVLPVDIAKAAQDPNSAWGKYTSATSRTWRATSTTWSVVREFLQLPL